MHTKCIIIVITHAHELLTTASSIAIRASGLVVFSRDHGKFFKRHTAKSTLEASSVPVICGMLQSSKYYHATLTIDPGTSCPRKRTALRRLGNPLSSAEFCLLLVVGAPCIVLMNRTSIITVILISVYIDRLIDSDSLLVINVICDGLLYQLQCSQTISGYR